jgi:hypothetical protein
MAKLTDQQKDILRLTLRSKRLDDGWYGVSQAIWPHIKDALPTDLAETRQSDEGGFIRLTDRGQAVVDYL